MSQSFFDKLKKGMDVEDISFEDLENSLEPEAALASAKKIKVKEDKKENKKEDNKEWLKKPEGELTADVYQTDKELVIQAPIAGVKPEDIDINLENDMLTIKGVRKNIVEEEEKNYFHQECYWGRFIKELILPVEVDNSRVEATMKEGILIIRMPKIEKDKKRTISVKK